MVEPGYTCQGRPYSCAKPQGEEHPEAAPPAGDADTSSTLTDHDRCMLFGCVTGQWSSPTGCVIRLQNGASCAVNESCSSSVCNSDGVCGLKVGAVYTTDASCRENACSNGLMACSQPPGVRRPSSLHDGAALLLIGGCPIVPERRRTRRRLAQQARVFGLLALAAVFGPQRSSHAAEATDVNANVNGHGSIVAAGHGFALSPQPVQQMGAPFLVVDSFAPTQLQRPAKHRLSLRSSVMYVPRPLLICSNRSAKVYSAVVRRQLTAFITGTYWWRGRLRLSFTVPVLVYGDGELVVASPVPYLSPPCGGGLGDGRFNYGGLVGVSCRLARFD